MTQRRRPIRQVVCPDDTEPGITAHACQLCVNQLYEVGEHPEEYSH